LQWPGHATKDRRVNVLVLSLTRFGDLLQTQPVLSGLKAQGHATGLVCLENFAGAAALLRDLDQTLPLRGARFLACLERGDWRGSLGELDGFLAGVRRSFRPDVLVNLTPSLSARLLARALGAAEVRGFCVDPFGFNDDASDWAAFLQLASAQRGQSPFNVADLFRRAAGLTGPGTPLELLPPLAEDRAWAGELLRSQEPAAGVRGYAALQLGASEDRRRWPESSFAELGARLWNERGLLPVLLGSAQEQALAERFRQAAPDLPCVDLTGRTSLNRLAAALTRCDLLVTNDTGTMHLAAGLGLPVAAIFLATAQPVDTGPYRPGCLCLEPDLDCHPCGFGRDCDRQEACRRAVDVEAVLSCAVSLLEPERGLGHVPGARVWRTVLDDEGFLGLESLSGHGGTDRARWLDAQRRLYRRFLDGLDPEPWTGPAPLRDPAAAASTAAALEKAAGLLQLLEQQLQLLQRDARPVFKAKFLANCRLLQSLFGDEPRLGVLGALWLFQSQQAARDLALLSLLIRRYGRLVRAFLSLFR
jgi:ADP-heptose:LPS heptosyltransferase